MKLLILGGTRFLGRHIAELALAQGHAVTLFHRGVSGPRLLPQAEHRLGDRNGDLSALASGTWDAVIDTSGYVPRQVRAAATLLRERIGHYAFVSSISVYANASQAGLTEDAALQSLPTPTTEEVTGETYGGLKVLCEQAVQELLPDRTLIARPGLLVGPHDPTGRFTYWVQRIADGGDVLAPGAPERQVQFIDARDAAIWLLQQAEGRGTGIFNLTGPAGQRTFTMGDFLQAARNALAPEARLHWVDEAFLLSQGVTPWTEVPLWVPPEDAGMLQVNIDRALRTGLRTRPLQQTLRDTLAWARQAEPALPAPQGPLRPETGLAHERESELLAHWRAGQHNVV